MFCRHCGKELPQNTSACPDCGTKVKKYTPKKATRPDKKSLLHTVIGFFFPVIGLILYLIWMEDYPLRAKSAGKGGDHRCGNIRISDRTQLVIFSPVFDFSSDFVLNKKRAADVSSGNVRGCYFFTQF